MLEQVLEILLPCYEDTGKAKQKVTAEVPDTPTELQNRFATLEVTDLQDDDLEALAKEILFANSEKSASSGDSKAKPRQTHELELELEPEVDLPFVIFCFFGYVHKARAFVQETWRQVAADELSDMVAALMTNLAIEVVQRAESDILALDPVRLRRPTAYQDICSVISLAQCEDEEGERPLENVGALNELVFGSVWLTLAKYREHAVKLVGPNPTPSLTWRVRSV